MDERNLNIVIMVRGLAPYWSDTVQDLAREWGDRGQVHCIYASKATDALHPWEEASPGPPGRAKFHLLAPFGGERLRTIWPPLELWPTLEQLDPAVLIVHEYSPYSVLGGLCWAKWRGVPCVLATDTGPFQRRQFTRLQVMVHNVVNFCVDGFLARTCDAEEQAKRAGKQHVLAPYAVDTSLHKALRRPRDRPCRLLQVGSLIPRKGADLLMQAVALARETRPDIEITFVGAGDHEDTRRQAAQLGIADAVRILPFLQPEQLSDVYAESDAFVLASRFDSYGVVTHEAAAFGLPLVVSKFAGSSLTLVEEGVNGFRIDPFDTRAFADAILQVLDPARHTSMCAASRRMAEDWDLKVQSAKIARWLEQLLGNGPRDARSAAQVVALLLPDGTGLASTLAQAVSAHCEACDRTVLVSADWPRERATPTGWEVRRLGESRVAERTWEALEELKPLTVVLADSPDDPFWSALLWTKANRRRCLLIRNGKRGGEAGSTLTGRLKRWIMHGAADAIGDAHDGGGPSALSKDSETSHAPFRLLYVGRLSASTGIDLLLRAFATAQARRPDIELVIAGTGDRSEAEAAVRSLGISQSVEVHPAPTAEAVRVEFGEADVFVVASLNENCGLAREAAASGLPVLASTQCPPAADMVRNDSNGRIADPRNTEAFAAAMLDCLDPFRHPLLTEAAARTAAEFQAASNARRLAHWIDQAAASSTHPSAITTGRPRGLWRAVWAAVWARTSRVLEFADADTFRTARRDVVFLNRYAPFYREGLFRRVASVWSTKIIHSGKRLGSLRSAANIESESVRSLVIPRDGSWQIVWLSALGAIMRTRPRVIITELSLSLASTWVLFLARPLLGFRLVFWAHGFQEHRTGQKRLGLADRIRLLWMEWADAVVFYGAQRMRDVQTFAGPDARFFLAPNIFDTRPYRRSWRVLEARGRATVKGDLGVPQGTMLYLGRLAVEKEVMLLPEIHDRVTRLVPGTALVIIGGGPEEDALRRARWGDGPVYFVGPLFDRDQLARWIYAADALVCPGYVGLNVVDALAMGTPIFTRSDGVTTKRHSPESAYLHPMWNSAVCSDTTQLTDQIAQQCRSSDAVGWDRTCIRNTFLGECTPELQFQGMAGAIEDVLLG
jgi:glycosyltransferase involved in cell wall biosynthesis